MRSAEIAGGGISGLGLAILLADAGWRVRIHERGDAIREVGAGIYLRNNPLRVLEEIGILDVIRHQALPLTRSQWRDGRGKLIQDQVLEGEGRLWMLPRRLVIQELERRARELGVEIRLSSRIVAARPEGSLISADGEEHAADLVVGADGQASAVRESLHLTEKREILSSIATRFIVPSRSFEPNAWTTMYWSGRRRVGVSALSENQTYVYLISSEKDVAGKQVPIHSESWKAALPVLEPLIDELAGLPSIQHPYVLVESKRWSRGNAAILGDAAHGLPPLLGQGAGLALSNAWALAQSVTTDETGDVPSSLAAWETEFRPYTDTTQNWSLGLDLMTRLWPKFLLPLRAPALSAIGNLPALQKRMRIADGFPVIPSHPAP
jgi:2-polyprenyl-6-methoxyphenol hydroxylase-like FAD-dependent oxidoreductase